MKLTDITFGFRDSTLDRVVNAVQTRFGHTFELRSSSFLGGDYFFAASQGMEILVHPNRDGDEIAEAGYEEYSVMLRVDACDNVSPWKEFVQHFNGVVIRESTYD